MTTGPTLRYRFGPFLLDPENRLLLRDREPISLTPKAFDTLLLLVERSGRLVLKVDLMNALWPNTFVDESNLTQTVFMLRKAMGETGSDQYIVTVPGRGYRFAAAVKQISGDEPLPLDAPLGGQSEVRPALSPIKRWPVVLAMAIALIAGVVYLQWSHAHAGPQPSSRKLMLAVLPFENLTRDAGEEYFSDGLTEEMIAQLGRLDPEHLGVIARTSVMHYKHTEVPLEQIGRELGVEYVLEGSVRRDSSKVRITAQLIKTKDKTDVWSRQYDRQLSSLLTLQGEIAQEIADEIQLTLGGAKRTNPSPRPPPSTKDYEAYDLYLKGRYFWNKRSTQGFPRAVEYFQQAIAKDPNYARAYAGLADSYALISSYHFAPQDEFMPKARAAALKALQLDERLAEAHTSLALIIENYDWDWPGAEKEFRRAIQLDPNYATAHHWYAEYLSFQGRFDEAFAEIERARQLDPLSLIIAADNGSILYYSRQYDRAIQQLQAVLDMDPAFGRAHIVIGPLVQKGRFDDALADIEKWRRRALSGLTPPRRLGQIARSA
jgi:TolB-like protein/DNA-binding winged helix-turn-helix (wHTH) protein/Tfp pilus assembly protein PilF